MGKVESGTVKYGFTYQIMPSRAFVEVLWLHNTEEIGVPYALPGECVRVSLFCNLFLAYSKRS